MRSIGPGFRERCAQALEYEVRWPQFQREQLLVVFIVETLEPGKPMKLDGCFKQEERGRPDRESHKEYTFAS